MQHKSYGGYVYLIGESNDSNLFKIGATKRKRTLMIEKRITSRGNPNELNVVDYFETTKLI